MSSSPLILTLELDALSFSKFDAERRLHFPAALNFIPAHLTLFHHLPGDLLSDISAALTNLAARQAPFPMLVDTLRFLGHGTAYSIDSATLLSLRARLAVRWRDHLTRQDSQGFRPHITIQNKTSKSIATRLFEQLGGSFEPFQATATGLLLWHYRGGPWEPAGRFSFTS